ncbi:glycolate oxidase [Plectosphaerella cucumerina]|uniref:Glycolate oxidase n=1 Tax=Plectosphaerella cucumerina TaxID=40658 RepID=A0A8K0X9X7_9PEZI|nr:glycolate oxidase [Plectosphaerella cucumerina]
MASTNTQPRYPDFPEAGQKHRKIFDSTLLRALQPVLPPGLDQAQFDRAVSELVKQLGADSVFVGEALRDYVDPFELWEVEGQRRIPSAAVLPRSVAEIQSVLQIARTYKLPLWTFSQGKNFGYGGPAPIVNGSVAVDLHRLNKIIKVDDQLCYAVVEPGVSFLDMNDHCVKNGLKLWPSGPSLPWGSMIGNTLDRGMGFLPTGVHHHHIAGLEVLLANGEVIRTGQFAISDSETAHLSKHSFGPSLEGLFIQSNLGIVTKMGIWLTPRPQSYMFCKLQMPERDDIKTIVDVLGPLRRNGVIDSTTWGGSASEFIAMRFKRAEVWEGEGPIPDWRLRELLTKFGLGFWTVHFGLYGPEEVIKAHFNEIKKVVEEQAPTGKLTANLYSDKSAELLTGDVLAEGDLDLFINKPGFQAMEVLKFNLPLDDTDCVPAHRDFAPIMPAVGATVLDWVKTSQEICEAEGFDLFCDFFLQERSVIFIYLTTLDKANEKQRKALEKITTRFHEEARKRKFAAYRTHILDMDRNAQAFDFNNHSYRRFVETLKDTLDPRGILSPGKQGIWPQRFRTGRTDNSGYNPSL